MPPRTRRELEIADHLWDCLTRIAEDTGTDRSAVANQAIFELARRFNFLTPVAKPAPAPGPGAPRPQPQQQAQPAPPEGARRPTRAAVAKKLYAVSSSGESFKIEKDNFVIGRSRNCDMVIPSSKVSRQHAAVTTQASDFFIEDLGSPNGVWRDGMKITREKIRDGDEFMLSDEIVKFVFRAE